MESTQFFSWMVVVKKKKKIIYFHFYLMFPNIKKSQNSYTDYLKGDHAKQRKMYTTITLLQVCCSVQLCEPPKPECMFTCPQNPTTNMQDSCYFVSVSPFINYFFYLGGTRGLRNLAAQFYPTTPHK